MLVMAASRHAQPLSFFVVKCSHGNTTSVVERFVVAVGLFGWSAEV